MSINDKTNLSILVLEGGLGIGTQVSATFGSSTSVLLSGGDSLSPLRWVEASSAIQVQPSFSSLSVAAGLQVGSNASFAGSSSFVGLSVSSTATFSGSTALQGLTVASNATFSGSAALQGLTVSSAATFSGSTSLQGITVASTAAFTGAASFLGVTHSSTSTFNGSAVFNQNASFAGISVASSSTFAGTSTHNGGLLVSSTSAFTGSTSFVGFSNSSNATLTTMSVASVSTFAGSAVFNAGASFVGISTSSNASFTGGITASSASVLAGLSVGSNSTIVGGLTAQSCSVLAGLSAASNVSFTGTVVSTLKPTDQTFNLGASNQAWVDIYGTTLRGPSNGGIDMRGRTASTAVAVGMLHEVISVSVPQSLAVSLASGTSKTVGSVSLTPGWWRASAIIQYKPAGSTSVTDIDSGISKTDNTFLGSSFRGTPSPTGEIEIERASAAYIPGGPIDQIIPSYSFYVPTTATYYLIAQSFFSVSTMAVGGYMQFERM